MSIRTALRRTMTATLLASLVLGATAAPTVFAGGKGGGGSTASGDSLTLVPLYTHAGGPVIGDHVTFSLKTSQAYPYVRVNCYQGGTLVYTADRGFYASYPWGQDYQLGPTSLWTSGSASCRADLYYVSRKGNVTTASLSFSVSG